MPSSGRAKWSGSDAATVTLDSLSVQQLTAVKKQLDDEVEHLTSSYAQLSVAQAKFKECSRVLKAAPWVAAADGGILVPLTNSLYVRGTIRDPDRVLVDVGTGFYAGKVRAPNATEAKQRLMRSSLPACRPATSRRWNEHPNSTKKRCGSWAPISRTSRLSCKARRTTCGRWKEVGLKPWSTQPMEASGDVLTVDRHSSARQGHDGQPVTSISWASSSFYVLISVAVCCRPAPASRCPVKRLPASGQPPRVPRHQRVPVFQASPGLFFVHGVPHEFLHVSDAI